MIKNRFFKISIISLFLFNMAGYAYVIYMYQYHKKDYWTALLVDYPANEYKKAKGKLLPYAKNGDLDASYYIGRMYALGQGTKTDEKNAEYWFHCDGIRACVNGEAEYFMGLEILLSTNLTTNIDKSRGLCWLKRSAEKGYVRALDLLKNKK